MKPTIMVNVSPEIAIFLKILFLIMFAYIIGDIFWKRKKSKQKTNDPLKISYPPRVPTRKKLERY